MTMSRRKFIRATGGAALAAGVVGRLADPAALLAQESKASPLSPELEDLFKEWIVIDALGGPGELNDEGFAAVAKSGATMVETTLGSTGNPTFTYEQAIKDIAKWEANFDRFPDKLVRVDTSKDILRAKQEGKLAVMIGFQNATQLKRDIRNLEFFYDLGIRQIQLTYNALNALGSGCDDRYDVGLSYFGVDVVKKMNELGMLVDLSHCGVRITLDAIEASSKPVIFSHSNCETLNYNPRCKNDEEIRRLAAKGGVMGMTTVNFFVSKKDRSTLDDFIAHIEYAAKLVGIEHVGIGTDSSIAGWRSEFPDAKSFYAFHEQFHYRPELDVRWPPFIEELDVPEMYKIIANRLSQKGFSNSDIQKVMGGNFLRVYEQVLG